MSEIQVLLPKMGESVAEATITKWLKKEGDRVELEESLVEIATDKVDSEIPSPQSGILTKILFKDGEVVKVGEALALISSLEKPLNVQAPVHQHKFSSAEHPENISKGAMLKEKTDSPSVQESSGLVPEKISVAGKFYSPLVRNIARQEGISIAELENLGGSGKDGRLTKQDVLNFLPKRKSTSTIPPMIREVVPQHKDPGNAIFPIGEVKGGASSEIIEMDRMRKLIADHMVMSKHTSPHVTSFVEVDVTNLVTWRDKAKLIYEKRDNEKITFTPIFVEATVKALKDFPLVNVSVDGYKIILKKQINIGIATALPSGNLIVPVIKNAGYLNLPGLTKAVNDLASRARQNKLKPEEIQDGTFTLTNVGTFGNVMGTPIINQPQVAILATGAIRKKPAVIETPAGDSIGIRHMMFLSLSYDHRVVDGALGGTFLRRIADYLEKFDVNRDI